jgi:putative Mn2+ efflux pump MntP
MHIISLLLVSAAVTFEFFSIAQRMSFFLDQSYAKKTALFFITVALSIVVFAGIGKSIEYILEIFQLNLFWTFILLLAIIALKYFIESTKKMHVKKTINPVFFNNMLGLIVAVGLNILIASIALSAYFSLYNILTFLFIFSFLFAIIGFFVGTLVNKLLNFRLELFSGLLILGVIIKHLVDYNLMK